ncbi:DUF58 domain-containing protein [Xylophilus rhododendri]|uniref:DUF58 domain-containing protein n=1 Tax=Xylophilus rhododendri TaxID=2697032 RepID=A0A857JBT0_9BURK|nr:DUF58 domain-containing protein [Xylophilus rhododendri]QHJ01465.1 DUF58 domain-containing protein [Xylophilus rhododendri]
MRKRPPSPEAAPAAPPESAAALLRRIEWTALRRLDGLLQGGFPTLSRGAGMDLADLREYQPSDDVRHIDWNVTARLDVPHVRVFTEDREMSACLIADGSGSMDFGSSPRTKRVVQTEFVALMAQLLTRHGNRVGGLLGGSGNAGWLPARGGREQVMRLLEQLQKRRPPAADDGGLAQWLQAAGRGLRRRSTVFVVSDFISPPGWERPLARLVERHDVIAVRLVDPLEQALPDVGLLTLRDAETGEQMLVDTHDRVFRQRFARAAAAREEKLRESFAVAGADALELSTTCDLADAIARFAELRRRRARRLAAPTHAA